MKERNDNYNEKKKHLEAMSDQQLKEYFFKLAEKLVDPLVELGYKNTTKSIERSVLLRMGFNSLESKEIVDQLHELNLLRKGAGHCVFRLAKDKSLSLADAGDMIISGEGHKYLQEVFSK